jgi:hypothetical protein
VRITNTGQTRATISRLNFYDGFDRLDTVSGDVFLTINKGTGLPAIGRTLQFPADNTATYLLRFNVEDADLAHAAVLDLPLLDRRLANGPIESMDAVRGWVFFQSKSFFPSEILIELTDILGHTSKHTVKHSNRIATGDLMVRTYTLVQMVDLSSTIQNAMQQP